MVATEIDREVLKDVGKLMVSETMRWVKLKGGDWGETQGVVEHAFAYCLRTYDGRKGTRFSTWLTRVIRNMLKESERQEMKWTNRNRVSMEVCEGAKAAPDLVDELLFWASDDERVLTETVIRVWKERGRGSSVGVWGKVVEVLEREGWGRERVRKTKEDATDTWLWVQRLKAEGR